MVDPSTPTPPQIEDQSQWSTKPKCRRATRLRDLTVSRNADQRLSIQFDMSTGKVIGDNRARFTSFVALHGRDHVPEEVKNQIWQTIMLTYDVPNNNLLRSKWISYVGQRWRGFKSDLTSRYIHDLQKNNLHPHRLSRGGYDRLEEIMIREASSLATDDQLDLSLISPPPRHEKWKRTRTKPSGEYISEETRLVAEKIDDLVKKALKGVGLKQFFGSPTRKVTLAQLSESDKKLDELLSEIKSEIASLGLAIQDPPKGASHVTSIKGSCPLPEELGDNVPVDCELYVDDPHWNLVALDIKDSSARVPLPSEEVQTVGQAPGNFIIWPARLAKPILDVSKKTNIVAPPQPQLSHLQQLGAAVVTIGNKTIEIDMPPELTCKTATTT
ncbi:hypothetical protein V8G54_003249 [Vigna mungo]|uniref:Uncharacterized protein n=1 Tax=Vigna mungo TaxID=3915 RepID=A0AAQ3PA50_VIGMU